MRKGGSAQDRRRLRRAEIRLARAATLAASGSTSLGLSDRNAPWDSGAAEKSLATGQYADAHFWRDPKGDPKTLAAYKLPFAKNDGGLTAVWKAVTAAAAAVQGARGGVKIPSGDVAGVKTKIGAYYTKARTKYNDPSIKPPWQADSAKGETAAILLALAEVPITAVYDEESYVGVDAEAAASLIAEFNDRVAYWNEAFAATGKCADCGHMAIAHAGSDNMGSCSMQGCDCNGFAEKQSTSDLDAEPSFTAVFQLEDFQLVDQASWEEFGKLAYARSLGFAGPPPAPTTSPGDLPDDHQPGERRPKRNPSPKAPAPTPMPNRNAALSWTATIAPEGSLTDDGRAFAPGSISWRELPLSLGAMLDTPHADNVTASPVAGRIDDIWREGNLLKAKGVFDSGEYGLEIARMVGDGTLRGVSVDLAVNKFEVGPKGDYFNDEGEWTREAPVEGEDAPEPKSLLDVLFGDEDSIFVVTDGTIGAVTVCPFPAFADAQIKVGDSLVAGANPAVWTVTSQAAWTVVSRPLTASADGEVEEEPEDGTEALTASAVGIAPVSPPVEWFDDPQLDGPTPLVVDENGRISGHAAAWDVCHIGIPGTCTVAPHSATNYAYYHLKEVVCDDGSRIGCGTITLRTGHADRNLGRAAAGAHYDDTGTAVADVVVGEDDYGIWVAGALRGDVDENVARELRGATLSGDWRDVNGNLELVALLAVNVPGFPVPRTPSAAIVASGEEEFHTMALLSAGLLDGEKKPLSTGDRERFAALRDVNEGRWDMVREIARGRGPE